MEEIVDFTIITVTYNSDKTLEKTILSGINQIYKGFEKHRFLLKHILSLPVSEYITFSKVAKHETRI
ncbi:hypothetical protein GCM10007084_39610 [Parabacteroides faecis]|uniref:Uncharacterized protein n=1 Tax=Parabacteroides faecis TaxID=1217282 RepID=A0ABR6KS67_9BACT|nr:hypothetical protein [Parabacteroides faecis]GGK12344.1 hypothetical protein GCM10007084_39610 [Parabacteroides faecis]